MIDRLHAAGHVTREPDPGDRQRIIVAATPESLNQVSACYTPLNDRLSADLAEFGEARLALLLRFARAAEESTDAEICRLRE